MIRRFKDWWLGGDLKCQCHRFIKVTGMGPIPHFGERERRQKMGHQVFGKCMSVEEEWH